jgi:hypothetical protein
VRIELDGAWADQPLALTPRSLNGHALGPLDSALIPAGSSFTAQGEDAGKRLNRSPHLPFLTQDADF